LTNVAPSNPIENNIFSPLAYNIPKNKDFANRTIVPQSMQDRSPQYQYDEKTSEIAKKIGEITKLSPKQVDYIIKSYTGVIGQLGLPASIKSNYSKNTLNNLTQSTTSQFISDSAYSNQQLTDFYDNLGKLKTAAADKNFLGNIPSKTITNEEKLSNQFQKASKEITKLSKQATLTNDTNEQRVLRLKMIKLAMQANKSLDK
jgi:hypothetical protein